MQKVCERCGHLLDEGNFYTYRDGTKTELCKKCLTARVDAFDPDTFMWLLEKMDVPYIPTEWNILRDKAFAKDPYKVNGTAIFGKYLSKMRLNQWKSYRWRDSEKCQRDAEAKKTKTEEELHAFEAEIKEKYENGEIPKAQYQTLMSTETQHKEVEAAKRTKAMTSTNEFGFNEQDFISEEELDDPSAELTKEDKLYLAMKWGRLYKPNEWIELERKYEEMMQGFDIQDPDTKNALILVCKTYLKMNQAINYEISVAFKPCEPYQGCGFCTC